MRLKKQECDVVYIKLPTTDGEPPQEFAVFAMTIRQRTRMETILAHCGATSIREALLISAVDQVESGDGKWVRSPAFDTADFVDQVDKDEAPEGLSKSQLESWIESEALKLLVADLSTWPASQLEPLVQIAQAKNPWLGNV